MTKLIDTSPEALRRLSRAIDDYGTCTEDDIDKASELLLAIAAEKEAVEPLTWAIAYKGAPYRLWEHGDGPLLDSEVRRQGGDYHKMALYGAPQHHTAQHLHMSEAYAEAKVAAVAATQTQAAQDVLAERRRQAESEGWTPEHDDEHDDGELARAAAVYANPGYWDVFGCGQYIGWPWAASWWKPRDARSNLVKAGALILAEIERLDRAARKGTA